MQALLIDLLLQLHLRVLEPVIKDAIKAAQNLVVRKNVKAATRFVEIQKSKGCKTLT